MSTHILVTVEIETRTCPVCGVHYGVDKALIDRRLREGGHWFCTNGDSLSFIEPEVEKLRKQLASAQGNLNFYRSYSEQKEAEAKELGKQVRAQKAAKTRLMRRVTNGVCPCCQRHFANVQRHMQSRHPDSVIGPTVLETA